MIPLVCIAQAHYQCQDLRRPRHGHGRVFCCFWPPFSTALKPSVPISNSFHSGSDLLGYSFFVGGCFLLVLLWHWEGCVDADPSVNWSGRSLTNSIADEIHQIFNKIQLLSNNTIKLSTLKVYSIQARHGRLRTIQVKAIPAAP